MIDNGDEGADRQGAIGVENETLRQGFVMVPVTLLKRKGLSRDAKLLYGLLLNYAWTSERVFPKYDTLIEDMECGRSQLSKYLAELKDADLLHVRRPGQGKPNEYTLMDVPSLHVQKSQNGTTRSPIPVVPKRNYRKSQNGTTGSHKTGLEIDEEKKTNRSRPGVKVVASAEAPLAGENGSHDSRDDGAGPASESGQPAPLAPLSAPPAAPRVGKGNERVTALTDAVRALGIADYSPKGDGYACKAIKDSDYDVEVIARAYVAAINGTWQIKADVTVPNVLARLPAFLAQEQGGNAHLGHADGFKGRVSNGRYLTDHL